MNNFYVYVYYHPETNKPFYVGKGKNFRLNSHWARRFNHANKLLRNVLLKIDKLGLLPIIKKVKENLSNFDSFFEEHILIKKYGRIGLDEGGILCNRSLGFEHCNVIRDINDIDYLQLKKYFNDNPHFNETIIDESEKEEICFLYQSKCIGLVKLSKMFSHGPGKIKNVLLEKNITIRNRGAQHDVENSMYGTKRGYNSHFKGKKHSNEAIEKIKKSMRERPVRKIKVNDYVYESANDASIKLGIPITTLRRWANSKTKPRISSIRCVEYVN